MKLRYLNNRSVLDEWSFTQKLVLSEALFALRGQCELGRRDTACDRELPPKPNSCYVPAAHVERISAHPWMAAPSEAAIVGQGFCEAHADAGAARNPFSSEGRTIAWSRNPNDSGPE